MNKQDKEGLGSPGRACEEIACANRGKVAYAFVCKSTRPLALDRQNQFFAGWGPAVDFSKAKQPWNMRRTRQGSERVFASQSSSAARCSWWFRLQAQSNIQTILVSQLRQLVEVRAPD